MLATLALLLAPTALPEEGWARFDLPALESRGWIGCGPDGEASLDNDHIHWSSDDRSLTAPRADRIVVYVDFEKGAPINARAFSPACKVRSGEDAVKVSLSGDQAVERFTTWIADGNDDVAGTLIAALAHLDNDAVVAELDAIAERDEDDHAQQAMFWLAQRRGDAGRAVLLKHLEPRWPLEHREHAVMSLALSGEPESMAIVSRIAREESDDSLRAHAVTGLGISDATGALAELHSIFLADTDHDVRVQALFGIAQQESGEAAEVLAAIIRNPAHAELRRDALFWLAQMEGAEAQAVMDELMADVL